MNQDQELGQLMHEMEKIRGKSSRGKPLGEFQILEQASARLGMYPSYAYRLLYRAKGPQTVIAPRKKSAHA